MVYRFTTLDHRQKPEAEYFKDITSAATFCERKSSKPYAYLARAASRIATSDGCLYKHRMVYHYRGEVRAHP